MAGAGATESTADIVCLMSCASSSSSASSSSASRCLRGRERWLGLRREEDEGDSDSDAEGERFGVASCDSIYIGVLTDGARDSWKPFKDDRPKFFCFARGRPERAHEKKKEKVRGCVDTCGSRIRTDTLRYCTHPPTMMTLMDARQSTACPRRLSFLGQ